MARPKEYENSKPKQRALYVEDEDYKLFCEKTKESFNKEINKFIKKTIKKK